MPYTFQEFKQWLINNPGWRAEHNINPNLDFLPIWESSWKKILCSNNLIVKRWLAEQGAQTRDYALIHWARFQEVIRQKKTDTKQILTEIKASLVKFIAEMKTLPSSFSTGNPRPIIMNTPQGSVMLLEEKPVYQEKDFLVLQQKLETLINH